MGIRGRHGGWLSSLLLVLPRLWVVSTAMTRPAPLLVVALLVAVLAALAAAADAPSASHSAVKNSKNSMHKSASRGSSDKDETKGASKSSSSSSSTASSSKSTSSSSSKSKGGGSSGGGVGVNDSSNQNFTLDSLPKTWQAGQKGTNQCNQWGKGSQDSLCQNAFINSLDDFCLWAPPDVGPIGETERIEVAWCMKPGYGTRLIPAGTIGAAHFIQTKDYVQLTGTGDLTRINVPSGDSGGELDPHGADGNGNPIGGLVFTNAYGKYRQVHEWMMFISDTDFCFRACKGRGEKAQALCQHVYDTMGCSWVMPANYGTGFDSCDGDVAQPPGIVGTSTFHQGDAVTPSAFPAPASSKCKSVSTLSAALTISTFTGAGAAAATGAAGGASAGSNNVAAAGSSSSRSGSLTAGAGSTQPLHLLVLAAVAALLSAAFAL